MSWWPQCSKPQYQTCHDSRLRSAICVSLIFAPKRNCSSFAGLQRSPELQLRTTTRKDNGCLRQLGDSGDSVEIRWDPWPVTKCQKSTTFYNFLQKIKTFETRLYNSVDFPVDKSRSGEESHARGNRIGNLFKLLRQELLHKVLTLRFTETWNIQRSLKMEQQS